MKPRTIFLATTLMLMCSFATLPAAHAVPAVLQVRGPIYITVPTSAGAMQSITVKAPAKGNMIVTVTGTVNYEFTSGAEAMWCLQLSMTSGWVGGCVPDSGSDSAIRSYYAADFPTTQSGFGAAAPYSIVRVWPVTAGTTYTFYLNGYGTGFDGIWLFQPSITVLYVPGTLAP